MKLSMKFSSELPDNKIEKKGVGKVRLSTSISCYLIKEHTDPSGDVALISFK